MKYAGGSLRLTDSRILNAPLVIMTGHDKDITVGRNLAKGGTVDQLLFCTGTSGFAEVHCRTRGDALFDDCGFHGLFAAIVADELQTIFPEYPLENLPHHHEIYNIYYQLPRPPTRRRCFLGV